MTGDGKGPNDDANSLYKVIAVEITVIDNTVIDKYAKQLISISAVI